MALDTITLAWLLTDTGQQLLAVAARADLREQAQLRELERLRQLASPAQAAAAYEVTVQRHRARTKFAHADRLYFTRDALEQASHQRVAAHRARRYAGYARVADLCCGAGGDALALAQLTSVAAVDLDPLRLALAQANAAATGSSARMSFHQLDLLHAPPPAADAIFFDPGRRSGARRIFDASAYQPPLATVQRWRDATALLGVKVAPGIMPDDYAALTPDEVEFVSLDGDLREATLWFGTDGAVRRRATVLAGETAVATLTLAHGALLPASRLSEPLQYLYEPDGTILRTGLVTLLAEQLDAAQFDTTIAYLTSDVAQTTPLARRWTIREWLPFSLKRLRARVRSYNPGPVAVKKRGSPLDTDALAHQLSGKGDQPLTVVLTQLRGRPIAIICT